MRKVLIVIGIAVGTLVAVVVVVVVFGLIVGLMAKVGPKSPAEPPGPMGVLPVPVAAKPWHENGEDPMNATTFVRTFYDKDSWTGEEKLFARRQFKSGVYWGWISAGYSQEGIAIMRFANASGAESEFKDLTGALAENMTKGETKITDTADGGQGVSNPKQDSMGNAIVEIAARVGNEVVDVHEFTSPKPDSAAAKALLLKQVKALQKQ